MSGRNGVVGVGKLNTGSWGATRRLFFALWPDEAVRQQLAAAASTLHRACGGRKVARENLHLTLIFVGPVAAQRLDDVMAIACGITAPGGFALSFGETGWWRHNRIVWVAPLSSPPVLSSLSKSLARVLYHAGLTGRPLHSFSPHVTLIRNARRSPQPCKLDFGWRVKDFVLVESHLSSDGPDYQVLQRWPLAE